LRLLEADWGCAASADGGDAWAGGDEVSWRESDGVIRSRIEELTQ